MNAYEQWAQTMSHGKHEGLKAQD